MRISDWSSDVCSSDLSSARTEFGDEGEGGTPRRRWLWPAAIAASLALVSVPIYQSFTGADTYATAVGGFQRLPLADGSRVDLNTNSRLDVASSQAVRRPHLEQGAAFRPEEPRAGKKSVRTC